MTAEHLLDAIGLLDDGLIQEAERYVSPKRRANYGTWLAWAASFALVLVLGYGVTHLGVIGGGGGNSGGNSQAAPNASAAPNAGGGSEWNGGSTAAGNGMPSTEDPLEPAGPASSQGDWLFALRVDGTVYWDTGEYIDLEPEESDIRYTTSFANVAEPEEDGQSNFYPVGVRYVVLEDGKVAVSWNESYEWRIFSPNRSPEP